MVEKICGKGEFWAWNGTVNVWSKLDTFPSARPLGGQFVVRGQEQPGIHVHTKFEECSFIRYIHIEGVQKFRNWARSPGHAHLGANFWSAGKNSPGSTCTPNLKSVASSDIEGVPNFVSPRSLAPEPIRHKINRLRGTVEEYYGSELQVIPIKRFLSRALTYIQTYKHTSKVKTVSTPMHYVCSAWITK